MKKLSILFLLVSFISISCSDDDDGKNASIPVESEQFSNLFAPVSGGGQGGAQSESGTFTKFDFKTGEITESETEWDIAFRGLAIAVNGGASTGSDGEPQRSGNAGASIVIGTFAEVTSIEGLTFEQDSETGYAIPRINNEGWYNYNFEQFVVTPLPGRVLVFRTRDGKYAKMEILSYYQDNPGNITEESVPRYYTFNYVYNPNEGEISLD
ncbi:HmuY family protein [Aquimarina sp. U1-2]|uniref:HmuY family protein n=1 Tax=Aquimarina sp. U1-2 TaxID=2823141 RepID=UPI001AEC9A5A|nr:HmuY family protein [Aquimarina sp. U1-2]MBP2832388.1 HmuY family protein [Aquimarina sp. U1-2]